MFLQLKQVWISKDHKAYFKNMHQTKNFPSKEITYKHIGKSPNYKDRAGNKAT